MIAAIVVLVLFATLSVFIVNLSSSQQVGSALDVEGTQAFLAAEAGIEWGKCQTLPACNGTASANCAASTTLTVSGFTVVANCATASTGSAIEAGLGSIYLLTATACNSSACPNASPSAFYVERRVSALIER